MAHNNETWRSPESISNVIEDFFRVIRKSDIANTQLLTISSCALDDDFTFKESESAIRKACGVDTIQSEYIRDGGCLLILFIVHLFNKIERTSRVPTMWKKGPIVPIFKGWNKTQHLRQLSLVTILYKLLGKVWYVGLMEKLYNIGVTVTIFLCIACAY